MRRFRCEKRVKRPVIAEKPSRLAPQKLAIAKKRECSVTLEPVLGESPASGPEETWNLEDMWELQATNCSEEARSVPDATHPRHYHWTDWKDDLLQNQCTYYEIELLKSLY